MENVVLIVHLILALALIAVVLLQRNEGGLGAMGGGGGGGSVAGRAPATAMGKLTWLLAIAFICTSIALTIIAASNSAGSSVIDRLGNAPAPVAEETAPVLPGVDGGSLLPPVAGDDPLVPSAD